MDIELLLQFVAVIAIVTLLTQPVLVYAVWQVVKSMRSMESILRAGQSSGEAYRTWRDKTEP